MGNERRQPINYGGNEITDNLFRVPKAGWDASLHPSNASRLNADLVSFRPPTWVQWEVNSTSAQFHHIENGFGPVNLDFYPVAIDQLPIINGKQLTATEFVDYIRTHLNEFFDHDVATFGNLNAESRSKWHSSDPVGTMMSFQINIPGLPIADEGASVIATEVTPTSWIFSTLYTDEDTLHPVSGNREFGISILENGSILFYTRGADRITDKIGDMMPNMVFGGAHALWTSLQENLAEFVNEHGGQARVGLPISERFPWEDVLESFSPTIAWEDHDTDEYYTTRPAPGETVEQWEDRIASQRDPFLKISPGTDPYTAAKLNSILSPSDNDAQKDASNLMSLPDEGVDPDQALNEVLFPISLPDKPTDSGQAFEEVSYPQSLPDENFQFGTSQLDESQGDSSNLMSLPDEGVEPNQSYSEVSFPVSLPDGATDSGQTFEAVSYPESLPDDDFQFGANQFDTANDPDLAGFGPEYLLVTPIQDEVLKTNANEGQNENLEFRVDILPPLDIESESLPDEDFQFSTDRINTANDPEITGFRPENSLVTPANIEASSTIITETDISADLPDSDDQSNSLISLPDADLNDSDGDLLPDDNLVENDEELPDDDVSSIGDTLPNDDDDDVVSEEIMSDDFTSEVDEVVDEVQYNPYG